MEVRNIQRTGRMHYVYLPTNWCRKHKVSSSTKVTIDENPDGSLIVAPEAIKASNKSKPIYLTIPSGYEKVLINVIVACYVNPTASFNIKMEKKVDMTNLLQQKNILSALEFVEFDGEVITYETSMEILEPNLLLKTMLKKIKNLLYVMTNNCDVELIERYEEEIDRSKILIQKSVIGALASAANIKLKNIDLYYIVQLATELERLTDHVILFDKVDKNYLHELVPLIDSVKELIEDVQKIDYLKSVYFTKNVIDLKENKSDSAKNTVKGKIKRHLLNIAEILLDWSISGKIEN